MNELQKKLIEICIAFKNLCDQLGLKYFAFGGTALGAVRHKGFIPWDDDVDFAMPRKDYEILLKKGTSLLQGPFFIQCYRSDKEYFEEYTKIRNSSTTFIENGYGIKQNMNHGLYIDIFPLDSMPDNNRLIIKFNKTLDVFNRRYHYLFTSHTIRGLFYDIYILCTHPSKKLFLHTLKRKRIKYSKIASEYFVLGSGKINKLFKKIWFNKATLFQFENIFLPVPSEYDDYLTKHYGNWKELPKEEERIPSHSYLVDLMRPYTQYKHLYGRKNANKK